jgi:hypothetical protein
MQVQHIENFRLKPGMHLQCAGGLKTVKNVRRSQCGLAIIEFVNGHRTALALQARSRVIIPG